MAKLAMMITKAKVQTLMGYSVIGLIATIVIAFVFPPPHYGIWHFLAGFFFFGFLATALVGYIVADSMHDAETESKEAKRAVLETEKSALEIEKLRLEVRKLRSEAKKKRRPFRPPS